MTGPSARLTGAQLERLLGLWRGRGPAYGDLASAVRTLLRDGRLALEVRLPAERELAAALGVSRTTVAAAYEQLRSDGFARSRRGSGSWTTLPGQGDSPPARPWASGPSADPDVIELTIAAVSAPTAITAAVAEAADDLGRYLGGHGYEPLGLDVLREAVAEGYCARGLATSPDQILVTNGAQHAFDLILRLLTSAGDRVVVESPTYPGALGALRATSARPVGVGMLDDGWNVELYDATLRQAAPRLAFIVPDFQNPTGLLMADDQRAAMAAAARRSGVHVVVDETFVDLAVDEVELPAPFASHDRDGRVLTIGSMSKSYWGGLRVGWVRATPPLVHRLAAVRSTIDMAGSVLDQLVATRLLERSTSVLEPRRARLREQRDVLAHSLRAELPQWRFTMAPGGLCLWVELDAPISSRLVVVAATEGLRLGAGPSFGADGTLERFLRIAYSLPADTLVEAVRRLAIAHRRLGLGAGIERAPQIVA